MGDGRSRPLDERLVTPALAFVGSWAKLSALPAPIIPLKDTDRISLAYYVRSALSNISDSDRRELELISKFTSRDHELVWTPFSDMMGWAEGYKTIEKVSSIEGLPVVLTDNHTGYRVNKPLAFRALARREVPNINSYESLVKVVLNNLKYDQIRCEAL